MVSEGHAKKYIMDRLQPEELALLCLPLDCTLQDIAVRLDANKRGIVLIVDEEQRLLGTIVDGDIRRAVLANLKPNTSVIELLERKPPYYSKPVSAPVSLGHKVLAKIMQERSVRHIPLVDENDRVVGLFSLFDIIAEEAKSDILPLTAVVMAGGIGSRLYPLTRDVPKPMLPVGDRPVMEWILEKLRNTGLHHCVITTYYKPEIIMNHFGNGERLGITINYIHEDRPTGTAGSLARIPTEEWQKPLLVINGDILTQVDFRTMYAYHQDYHAMMTLAIREYSVQVPYGTITLDGVRVTNLIEKPSLQFFVNAGIYIIEPSLRSYFTTSDEYINMTQIVERVIADGRVVVGFPVTEYWLDIGQHEQYQQAQTDLMNGDFGG